MSETDTWPVRIVGHGMVDPRTLEPHPQNPKVHTAEQDAVVEASLRELGWLRGVMINRVTGHVLDGHERREIAIRAGQTEVPAEYVEVAADKEGQVLLTLDPSGTLYRTHVARWAALQRQVQTTEPALQQFFADMAARHEVGTGETGDASGWGQGHPETPAEERQAVAGQIAGAQAWVDELTAQWGVARGQVWQCGEHDVLCAAVEDGWAWAWVHEHRREVQGVFTSPPYAEQRAAEYGGVPASRYVEWFRGVAARVWEVLAADGSFFVNLKEHSEGVLRPVYVHALVVDLVERGGWWYLDEYCWERPGIPCDPAQHGKFKNQWEPVFWLAKQRRPIFHPERARHWSEHVLVPDGRHRGGSLKDYAGTGVDMLGGRSRREPGLAYPGNRLPTFGTPEALGQPAAFPVGLPRWFVEVYSEPGQVWLDPFLGSGTTLMACEETERRCVGFEPQVGYLAVTLQRYADHGAGWPERVQ